MENLLGALWRWRGALVTVMCAACQPTVAHVTFPVASLEVLNQGGALLPDPRCTTTDGKHLPLPPDVVWTVEPPGLADVVDGQLLPRRNGSGFVVVTVDNGRLSARLPVVVQRVDAVRLRCSEPSCRVRLGQTMRIKGTVLGEEVPLAGVSLQWTSGNPATAVVDDDGVVTGKEAGSVSIQAQAREVSASVRVEVVPRPDEIVVTCPNPAFSVAYKAPLGMRGTGTACLTGLERPARLVAQLRAQGVALPSEDVTWRSGDEKVVTVSGGVVTGLTKGTTFVEARAGDLSVSMAINVVPQRGGDDAMQCPGRMDR